MQVIRDRDGNVIQQSRNLAGIRRYVGKHTIDVLAIDAHEGEGHLAILFDNGCEFETDFASCVVLRDFVRRWRNVYGSPLEVQGEPRGLVSYDNPALS